MAFDSQPHRRKLLPSQIFDAEHATGFPDERRHARDCRRHAQDREMTAGFRGLFDGIDDDATAKAHFRMMKKEAAKHERHYIGRHGTAYISLAAMVTAAIIIAGRKIFRRRREVAFIASMG